MPRLHQLAELLQPLLAGRIAGPGEFDGGPTSQFGGFVDLSVVHVDGGEVGKEHRALLHRASVECGKGFAQGGARLVRLTGGKVGEALEAVEPGLIVVVHPGGNFMGDDEGVLGPVDRVEGRLGFPGLGVDLGLDRRQPRGQDREPGGIPVRTLQQVERGGEPAASGRNKAHVPQGDGRQVRVARLAGGVQRHAVVGTGAHRVT